MNDAAVPARQRASIWWWAGGLALGVAVVVAVAVAAAAVVVYIEVSRDNDANKEVEAQLPAVESAVAQVVRSRDPQPQVAAVGSCNGDTPARVSVFIPVEPESAAEVAGELVREARESGWKPSTDPGASDGQLERTFGGMAFNFEALPQADSVFVRSYYLGVENC